MPCGIGVEVGLEAGFLFKAAQWWRDELWEVYFGKEPLSLAMKESLEPKIKIVIGSRLSSSCKNNLLYNTNGFLKQFLFAKSKFPHAYFFFFFHFCQITYFIIANIRKIVNMTFTMFTTLH
jgi:hypothetical protein